MNVLVQLCHPAQYYYYRYVMRNLVKDGHKVYVLIKSKDILEDLLKRDGVRYVNILPKDHRGTKPGYFLDMVVRDWRVLAFAVKHHIDLLTGSTPEISHIGWLLHRHSINIGEDDASVIGKYVKVTGPFLDTRLTPIVCDNGVMEKKAVKFDGYWKLAYLHPSVFTPDRSVVEKYFSCDEPYFLIRFAKLCAHHDSHIGGVNLEVAGKMVGLLSPYGRILISSEKELPAELEKYRIHINPLDIHHIMYFAQMYLGDSQSMAVEAAVLGVPSVRFSDFAGRISVLEELEHKYGLTFGISTSSPSQLYDRIEELLEMPSRREEFHRRREKMLREKINVTAFFTWFIENYPASRREMEDNPECQYRFR